MTSAAPAAAENPFKFLDHFRESEEDRRRFGGRDREIYDLVTRVVSQRTLVLFGPSGIGKTSLLLAGLFPALRERGARPVYVRVLSSPLADLRQALAGEGGGAAPAEPLRQAVARAAARGPLVVVLDQLEELFLRFGREDREAFAAALAEVIQDVSLRLTVVFSLRREYLARLDELARFLPDLLPHRYALQPLTPFGVRQAVTRPLADAGIPYEPAVVSRLCAELETVGFDPVLLQILCTDLHKRGAARAGGGPLRLEASDVRGLAGKNGVFLGYLNGVAESLPADVQLPARMLLEALITDEGTKQAVRLRDLPEAAFAATDEEALSIAGHLVGQRILRREEREGETWYELIHDQLIPALRAWLEADVEFSRFRQARAFIRNNAASEIWKEKPDAFGSLEALLAPFRERFRFKGREMELVVRNAIYHQSGQLAFWAEPERCGLERTRGLLLEMLESGRDVERLGAVASARRLPDDGSLARACLRRALYDSSQNVRREARVSLAALIRDEQMDELRRLRADPELKGRVIQTWAVLLAEGKELKGVGLLDRWRARRRQKKGLLDRARPAVLARLKAGMISGGVAGGLWGLGQLGLAEGVRYVRGTETYAPRYTWLILVVAVLGTALGAGFGGALAWAAAREAALRGEGRWLAALARRPWVPAVWMALPLFLFSIKVHEGWRGVNWESPPGGDPAFLALASLLPLLTARWCRPCVWPGISKAGACLAAATVSLGLPVLLMLAALRALRAWGPGDLLAGRVVELGYLLGFLSFVAILSLAFSTLRHPLGPVVETPPVRRLTLTALAVAALAAVPVFFGWHYGIDRFLPRIVDYPQQGILERGDGLVDPPVFEVTVPRVCGDLTLSRVAGRSNCRPVSCKDADGPKKRVWLKPPPEPPAPRYDRWCVLEAKKREP